MRIREAGGFTLRSRTVGAMPIVNRFMERMKIERILDGYMPTDDKRIKLPPGRGIALLLSHTSSPEKQFLSSTAG